MSYIAQPVETGFSENLVTQPPYINEPLVDTAPWLNPCREGPARSCAPVWSFREKRKIFSMQRPLMVCIRHEEGLVFVENDTFALYAHGATIGEAMADFAFHAIYFYGYYKNLSESKAVGEALRLKRLFEDLFIEE